MRLTPLKFESPTTPYKHQEDCFIETRDKDYYALFWEMGTGKTKTLIDTISYLYCNQQIDGALIVSDKGSYLNWKHEEFPKHLQHDVLHQCRIAHWSSQSRKEERMALDKIRGAVDDQLDIALVNVESLSSPRSLTFCREFMQNHHAIMIIDESTSIKNSKSQRTISCQILGNMAEYRRIATGTPIAQSPLDIYAQSEFLKQGLLGQRSFVAFRSRYAILREVIMGPRRFKVIAGYQMLDDLAKRMIPWSSRILKSECLDLPEKVYEVEHVEMTEQQAKAYDHLKNEALVMIDENMLTSTNAMTTVEKLHQICCGHLKMDEGGVVDIPHNRIDNLLELVDRIAGKVIIWCCYQRDVENVIEALRKHWVKDGCYPVHYYGKTTQDQRVEHLRLFANHPGCRGFVGTPTTGGKGLTLVNSSFVIYYSCGWKPEARLQSEDRCHRIGQTKSVTYVDMVCPQTIEMRILKALKDKKDLSDEILDNTRLRQLLLESPTAVH